MNCLFSHLTQFSKSNEEINMKNYQKNQILVAMVTLILYRNTYSPWNGLSVSDSYLNSLYGRHINAKNGTFCSKMQKNETFCFFCFCFCCHGNQDCYKICFLSNGTTLYLVYTMLLFFCTYDMLHCQQWNVDEFWHFFLRSTTSNFVY